MPFEIIALPALICFIFGIYKGLKTSKTND